MKIVRNITASGNQTKAVSLLIGCIAFSLLFSTTVVTYVVRWLMQS